MTDIVNIGFAVNSSQIEKGYKRMDKLGQSSEKTEGKITKMGKAAKTAGTSIAVVGTAGLAAVGAISSLVYQLGQAEREMQASARMAGLTTDQFEAMGFAYKQFELTVEQVNDIYKDSRERVGEWLNSQSGALQDFGDAMGMSKDEITAFAREVDDLNGQELLQRMVNDLESAGVSGTQMSGVLETMASEATRMIPALENNGEAVNKLSAEYAAFNAAFSLDEQEVQNYADLSKNFDLFLDTAQNGMTKTLVPLAEVMSVLAIEAADFLASLQSGSVSAAQNDYTEALGEQLKARELLSKALSLPEAFGDARDSEVKIARERLLAANEAVEAADKQLEAAKKTAQASLEVNRTSTRNVNVQFGSIAVPTVAETDSATNAIQRNAQAYDQWLQSVRDAAQPVEKLRDDIADLWLAMLDGDLSVDVATKRINQLEGQIDDLNKKDNPLSNMASGATEYLSAIQMLAEDGSDAYVKLERAIASVGIAQSLMTGNFAGAIASGVGLLMSFDKELKDLSVDIQANQNLDAWGEKADSISVATDITAHATEKLVGINSDMLNALKVVQNGITGASGIISQRNTGASVGIGGLGIIGNVLTDTAIGNFLTKGLDLNILNILSGGLLSGLGKALGGLLGGKSSVADEGVRVVGGYITDLTEGVLVQAYQLVSYKKHRFSSTRYKQAIKTLGGEVSNQFSLVFGSIIDSVASGAGVLGLSQKEINQAIDDFRIGTKKISLKGLSKERQQKELEAYFSGVFNSLATSVIPFLDEFQQAGEELGETLSRLATEVSVAEYLVDNLGVTMANKLADPKAFAQAANNLSTLAGGAEALVDQVSSFVNSFASDSQKFDIYQEALSEALNEVGLRLPATATGFYDLMASLDGSTESGQQQIATLLKLTDTADGYFRLLDSSVGKFREAAEGLYDVSFAAESVALDSALAAARLGDFSLADELDLGGLTPSKSDFASLVDYNIARAETASKLNELADLQSGSVSIDEKQLTVLEQIRDNIKSSESGNKEAQSGMMEKLNQQMMALKQEMQDVSEQLRYGTLTVTQEA